jgi:hypothetical protein
MISVFLVWSKRRTGKTVTERKQFQDETAIRKFMHNNPLCLSMRWNENPGGISGVSPELRRDEQLGSVERLTHSNCE